MKFKTINISVENKIASIELNRPDVLNAFNAELILELQQVTQIVKDESSLTYKVLKNLKTKGSDILVNTSFNISKDPVVFDLYDVYVIMQRMNIKFVLMVDGFYQIKDI